MSQTLKSHSYYNKQPNSLTKQNYFGTLPTFLHAPNQHTYKQRKPVSILNFHVPSVTPPTVVPVENPYDNHQNILRDDRLYGNNVNLNNNRFNSLRNMISNKQQYTNNANPYNARTQYSLKLPNKNYVVEPKIKIAALPKPTPETLIPTNKKAVKKTVSSLSSASPQSGSKTTQNKVLNLFKNYKSLLARIQKHFTDFDSNSSRKKSISVQTTVQASQNTPIMVDVTQDKATQTIINSPVEDEYDFLNNYKSPLMANTSKYINTSLTLSTASSTSLSFNLSNSIVTTTNDNPQIHDRLCDLEVASYFKQNDSKNCTDDDNDDGVDVDGYDEEEVETPQYELHSKRRTQSSMYNLNQNKYSTQKQFGIYDDCYPSKHVPTNHHSNYYLNYRYPSTSLNLNKNKNNSFIFSSNKFKSPKNPSVNQANNYKFTKNMSLTDFGTLC